MKSRKLKYFGHTTKHESLEKDIMLVIMPRKRRQDGQKKQWIDDIVQWGEKKPGRNGKTGGKQRRLPVLSS